MFNTPAQTQSNKSIYFMCGSLLFSLLAVNIFFSVRALHVSHTVAQLESEKASLIQSQKTLSHSISQSFSLAELDTYAQDQGFEAVRSTLSVQLPSDQAVALR